MNTIQEIKAELISNCKGRNDTMQRYAITYKGYRIEKVERIDTSVWYISTYYMREKQEVMYTKKYEREEAFEKALKRIIKKEV